MPGTINVTACDNELIVLAFQGNASYELCRILSGYKQKVNVTLNIQQGVYLGPIVLVGIVQPLNQTLPQYLPAGGYSLQLLGIDWGGPAQFTVNVNGVPYALPPTTQKDGLVFSPNPIPITI